MGLYSTYEVCKKKARTTYRGNTQDFISQKIMKTYKHKTLWWIARQDNTERYYTFDWDVKYYFPTKLIENSQDREEVVETDWIDDAIADYDVSEYNTDKRKYNLRKAIEKHCPPKVKKFTRDDILNFYDIYKWMKGNLMVHHICEFLIANWLLEE